MSENKNVALSTDQLKDLLATVISEGRKPIVTEKDLRQQASAREMKLAELAAENERIAAKEQQQKDCSHAHRAGNTRTVLIQYKDREYRICQICQKIIRPETERELFLYHAQRDMPPIF